MHPCHFLFHLNKPTDGSVLFRKLTQVTGSMISVWPLFRVLLNGFFFSKFSTDFSKGYYPRVFVFENQVPKSFFCNRQFFLYRPFVPIFIDTQKEHHKKQKDLEPYIWSGYKKVCEYGLFYHYTDKC